LARLGLLEWIPTLFESETEGEVIHPLGIGKTDEIEDRLRRAADRAGSGMLTGAQRQWARANGMILVPVLWTCPALVERHRVIRHGFFRTEPGL
jgi:hypothetical protein